MAARTRYTGPTRQAWAMPVTFGGLSILVVPAGAPPPRRSRPGTHLGRLPELDGLVLTRSGRGRARRPARQGGRARPNLRAGAGNGAVCTLFEDLIPNVGVPTRVWAPEHAHRAAPIPACGRRRYRCTTTWSSAANRGLGPDGAASLAGENRGVDTESLVTGETTCHAKSLTSSPAPAASSSSSSSSSPAVC